MPEGKKKSGRYRRVFVKTPGGRTTIHYRQQKASKALCARCKTPLHGVPTGILVEVMKLPKSSRRPERPFGGNLCSACTRQVLLRRARGLA